MRRSRQEAAARILEAAEAEFTRFGVIGARIDRIAREAHASKERLYAYFGDKQGSSIASSTTPSSDSTARTGSSTTTW